MLFVIHTLHPEKIIDLYGYLINMNADTKFGNLQINLHCNVMVLNSMNTTICFDLSLKKIDTKTGTNQLIHFAGLRPAEPTLLYQSAHPFCGASPRRTDFVVPISSSISRGFAPQNRLYCTNQLIHFAGLRPAEPTFLYQSAHPF